MAEDGKIELELRNRIKELENENSQLKKAYSTLYEENEIRFKELFDNIPVAYQSLDEEGRIREVNQYWLENLGYEEEEVIGKLFGDLWSNDTAKYFPDVYNGFKETCWINNAELKLKKKSGKINDFVLTGSIQKKNNNEFGKTHCIIYNITDLKNLQRSLKQSIETKDRFFSIIAHDLRGPIYSLNGMLTVLADDKTDLTENKKDEIIKTLSRSSVHILTLLENLLQWSSSQTNIIEVVKTEFSILPFISKIIEMLKSQAKIKNISISVDIDKTESIFADKNMLKIVILNILSNSIKFCNENGKIQVKTKILGDNIEIEITDNGVGIPKKDQVFIFKLSKSYTTRGTNNEKGTGLGLILCKEFVEKNNGIINFRSEENKGTSFYITMSNKAY